MKCVKCGEPALANLSRCKACLRADAARDRDLFACKACRTCGTVKPLEQFALVGRNARDGRRRDCLQCVRDGRAKPTPPMPRKVRAKAKAWKSTPEQREKARAAVADWSRRNPLAKVAHVRVMKARRSGKLVPPPCCEIERCKAKRVVAHHADYAQPLAVQWLCWRHHRLVHAGRAFSLKDGRKAA